jgi:RNA polymerase sigma-70 factor (ECF subfamily)
MTTDVREELVRLLPRLRRFAYSLCRDHDKSGDLVQETCARALAKIELWQPGTRFDSWLFRIAQNIWLDRVRAEKARGEAVEIDAAHEVMDSDGRDVAESRMTLAAVSRGMEALAAEQQVVVALVCVEGMSYKEAAEVLDIPIGTLTSRLARGGPGAQQSHGRSTAMDDKATTPGRIETQLQTWGAELDRLKAQVDRQIAEAKKEYYEHIEELREDMESALRKWGAELEGVRDRAETESQKALGQLRSKIEGELREWRPEIEGLMARASRAQSEADRLIADLKARHRALKARVGELRHASGGAWEDVKAGVGKAWEELKPALQNAIAKFK